MSNATVIRLPPSRASGTARGARGQGPEEARQVPPGHGAVTGDPAPAAGPPGGPAARRGWNPPAPRGRGPAPRPPGASARPRTLSVWKTLYRLTGWLAAGVTDERMFSTRRERGARHRATTTGLAVPAGNGCLPVCLSVRALLPGPLPYPELSRARSSGEFGTYSDVLFRRGRDSTSEGWGRNGGAPRSRGRRAGRRARSPREAGDPAGSRVRARSRRPARTHALPSRPGLPPRQTSWRSRGRAGTVRGRLRGTRHPGVRDGRTASLRRGRALGQRRHTRPCATTACRRPRVPAPLLPGAAAQAQGHLGARRVMPRDVLCDRGDPPACLSSASWESSGRGLGRSRLRGT